MPWRDYSDFQIFFSIFDYYGVPDEVDYRSIPWRNARFDEQELTRHVATQTRARNAYEQLSKHSGPASPESQLGKCSRRDSVDLPSPFI